MLTARQFAKRAGVAYPTVMKWLRAEIVPGAMFVTDSPLGSYWQIPATSLDAVEKRKPGPKPKAQAEDQDGAEKPTKKPRKAGSKRKGD